MRRVVPVVLGVLLAVAVLPLLPATPAQAAAGPPTNVAPTNGANVSGNPVFSWEPGTGAIRYLFQISQNNSFTPVISGGSIATTNTTLTFPTELPSDVPLYWRVTAYDTPSNVGGAVGPTWSFTRGSIAAPTGLVPSTSTQKDFVYPTEAPTFSWNPVAGAKSYEVTVSDNSNFTGPNVSGFPTTTTNTSFTLTDPLTMEQSFYWRVKAIATDNTPSPSSDVGTFRFCWGSCDAPVTPMPLYPPDQNVPAIEEVVFEWTAIPGAKQYDVEWSLSANFTNPTTVRTKSTRFSPGTTLDNSGYFWHVRGVTPINGTGRWSTDSRFTRAWPATETTPAELGSIALLSPDNADYLVTEPVFSWTPQRLGSRYNLQISTDANFSPGLTSSCITNHTTLSPKSGCGTDPVPNALYYWRVQALDDPRPIDGRFSAVRSFIYRPELVTLTGPGNGTLTSAPVLTWDPVSSPLIARYRVLVYNGAGSLVKQVETYNTSFKPGSNQSVSSYAPDALSTDPAYRQHTWKVQTVDVFGRIGPLPGTSRTFTMIDPPSTYPAPNQVSPNHARGTRVPPLTWQPVTGADRYNVWYSVAGANLYYPLVSDWRSTAYAHQTSSVSPGAYDWFVEAENSSGAVIASSTTFPRPDFTVVDLEWSAPVFPPNCPAQEQCDARYDTPTLDWEPVVGATHYKVYISYDKNFTNIVPGLPYETQYSTLTPQVSLVDNQTGQAYYWYARPCYSKSPERCGPEPAALANLPDSPVWAFQKQSHPLSLLAPANNAIVGNQITFSWKGFLQTNQASAPEPSPFGAPPAPPTQEARQYRIEVSTKADFSSVLDAAVVDQTTYTSYLKTYPEGPIFWRVAPIDGSNNRLVWSEVRTLTKESPLVTMSLPAPNAQVTEAPTLTVQPKPFEAEWEFEIYKNLSQTALSNGNRVFTKRSKVPAATPTVALPPLAPGEQYGWRVRRWDADNLQGAWTADDSIGLRRFTVSGSPITLTSPADGATVLGDEILYEWNVVNQATRYKVEVNTQQNFSGARPENDIITVTNNWAPRVTYADGVYWWRVSTLDASNNVLATSAARSFNTGEIGSRYQSIPPIRVLDSRTGNGWNGTLNANQPRSLTVAGAGLAAPAGATAVVLNVTAIESTAQSFITVYPNGSPIPNPGSALNFNAGQIIPNLVTVKVGDNGRVNFATAAGRVNVVADLVGFYDLGLGDRYNSVTPYRLLDSRQTGTQTYWSPQGPLNNDQSRDLQITGRGGVPANAKAAIVNITAVEGSQQSFLTAYPAGTSQPTASNVNFVGGQIIPNLAIVKIGAGGKIALYNNSGSVNVIVDVVGYFLTDSGSFFHPLAPNRILDTRVANGLSGAFGQGQIRALQVSGRGDVPAGASAVVMNTTAVEGSQASYLMVYPQNATKPTNASNLNFVAGQIIPNLVTVGLSPSGMINIYNNSGVVNVLGDVTGYYSAF